MSRPRRRQVLRTRHLMQPPQTPTAKSRPLKLLAPSRATTLARRPPDQDVPATARIHTRFDKPGMCAEDGPVLQARRALLETFRQVHHVDVTAHVAPEISDATVLVVTEHLRRVTDETAALAAMPITAPPLVIYNRLQDLLNTACVNPAALAYYDGALHVSVDVDAATLRQNLQHEIVHHALVSRGVQAPMWLQEGLAMRNAHEVWWANPQFGLLSWGLRYHHPFARMVHAFPHTTSEAAATAVYFQSLMMVQSLVAQGGDTRPWRLVDALASWQVSPDDAYAWGVATSDPQQQETLWRQTVRTTVMSALGPGYVVD